MGCKGKSRLGASENGFAFPVQETDMFGATLFAFLLPWPGRWRLELWQPSEEAKEHQKKTERACEMPANADLQSPS